MITTARRRAADAHAVRVELRAFSSMDAIGHEIGDGLGRDRQPLLYDRLDWIALTLEHIRPDAPAIMASARIGDDRGWLFLRNLGDRRAEALGSWYTLAFAPIFDAAPERQAALLGRIAAALRARFDSITLAPLAMETARQVETAFAEAGWWSSMQDSTANWVAHVATTDFEAYWRTRPSRLRNTVRRKLRDAGLTFHVHDRFDADAWARYEAIYAASWKGAEGSPAFLTALARQEGAAGTLRLGIACRNDRAVAAQFWTVEHGRATIHKLAHLETERAGSPGTLLTHAMFAHVITHDRPELIDFGTGDDSYKAEWMTERRMLSRITLFNRHSIGGIARAARAAGIALIRS